MLKTPFGEIKILINENEIEYSVIDCIIPENGQTLFCYKIVTKEKFKGNIECKIAVEKSVVTRNADYNCATIKMFEKDNFYLELCGLDINDCICHTTNNGLMFLNLDAEKMDKLEFVVAWIEDFKDVKDQRVWETIKSVLYLDNKIE